MGTGAFDSAWHVALRFGLSALAVYRASLLVAREDRSTEPHRRRHRAARHTFSVCIGCSAWIRVMRERCCATAYFDRSA